MKKSIIIFGAGGRLNKYIKMLDNVYDIRLIVDNDKNKCGNMVEGYVVFSTEKLLEYPELPVIIVSTYEEEICKQLENLGIKNFHTLFGLPYETDYEHRTKLLEYIKKGIIYSKSMTANEISEKVKGIYYNWNDHYLTRKIVLDMRDEIPLGSKILDYGFGCGTLVLNFLIKGYDAYGIDLDKGKKEIYDLKIKELFYPTEWIEHCQLYDGNTIPYDDEEFDYVFCDYVLEHVENLRSSINEMLRVLKSGGVLRIACPNYDSSFEEHYKVDFKKSLHGHKEEFKKYVYKLGYNTKELDTIFFVNLKDIKSVLEEYERVEIVDLNLVNPLEGINLIIRKLR